MKASKVYGLISALALTAVCASAFAQGGRPPQDDQNGPPRDMQQGPGGGGPGGKMGRRMGPGQEPILMRPDIQKELKLTDDQIEKIKALMPPPRMRPDGTPGQGGSGERGWQQGGPPPGGQAGGRRGGDADGRPNGDGDRQPRMGGGPEQMDDKLADILSDGQMKRLKELRLQRQGAMALMRPDIADRVGLTDDEREKLRGIIDDAMKAMRPAQGQDGPPDRKKMEAMHAKLNGQIVQSLTSSEKTKWNDLIGKPFKFDENWHPQRPKGGPDGDLRRRGDGPPPPPQDDGGNLEAAMVMEAMHSQDTDCF